MMGSDMTPLLKPLAGARIGAGDRKKQQAEAEIENIKHVRLLQRLFASCAIARAPRANFLNEIVRDQKYQGRDAETNERFRHERVSL